MSLIQHINYLAKNLSTLENAKELLTPSAISTMELALKQPLSAIVEDLKKGSTPDGGRKIDIDLQANSNAVFTKIHYTAASIVGTETVRYEFSEPVYEINGILDELLLAIAAYTSYAIGRDITPITNLDADILQHNGDCTAPWIIRFSDKVAEKYGTILEKVILHTDSVYAKEASPEYSWFKSSSAILQTFASNKVQATKWREYTQDYGAGHVIYSHSQLFKDGDKLYRVSGSTTLPYTTTGTGMPEDGAFVSVGDAALRRELANPDQGAAIVGWRRDKLRDSITSAAQMLNAQDVSIWEFAHLVTDRPDPADFETWDWHPALQAAIDSQTYVGPGVYRGGPAVKLTPGKFPCSETLIFSTAAKLYSYHSGMPYSQTSEIAFPENVLGIAINDRASRGVTAISPTGTSADGAWLEGMKISGGGGTSADAHGVLCRVRSILKNLWVTGFAGNGVRISSTYPGLPNSNANNGLIEMGRYELNGMHGLFITGTDANAWAINAADCSLNARSGIFDASFLGCTFTACHTATNGSAAKVHYEGNRYTVLSDTLGGGTTPGTDPDVWEFNKVGGVSSSWPEWTPGGDYFIGASYRSSALAGKAAFLGCYTETGQPPDIFSQSTLVLGGVTANNVPSTASVGAVVNSFKGQLQASNGFVATSRDAVFETQFGGVEGAYKTILKITDTALAPSSYRLRFLNDDIVFNYANGASYQSSMAFWITTIATTRTFGRTSPVPHALVSNRLFVGNANASRNITCVGALPVSGEYARGDILFHTNLTAGGKAGWACTTTGVAGSTAVFKPFGAIDL